MARNRELKMAIIYGVGRISCQKLLFFQGLMRTLLQDAGDLHMPGVLPAHYRALKARAPAVPCR